MKNILIQLDTDSRPSTFDRVVAIDAGVDELFSYGGITRENLVPLVHGAMFTRGPSDLKQTALFIGGSDVTAAEAVLAEVQRTFFGPMRVSVLMDANGCNTTAAAAVLAAGRHLNLSETEALVAGGTGPVGRRVVQLLAMQGTTVRVGSREADRAQAVCESVAAATGEGRLISCAAGSTDECRDACQGVDLIVAAGAAGVELIPADIRSAVKSLRVAIDLNAVPPTGLAGIEPTDNAVERDSAICYGAIGIGGVKMKIHKAAVASLFDANDRVLDAADVYRLGLSLTTR